MEGEGRVSEREGTEMKGERKEERREEGGVLRRGEDGVDS